MGDGNVRTKMWRAAIIGGMATAGAIGGLVLSWHWTTPSSRHLVIKARQYAYEPSVIHVQSGDTLHIRLVSLDVVHGFYVEGHDIDAEIRPQQKTFLLRHPSTGEDWQQVEELTFVAGRPGKYHYRCSHTCGTMHPFMLGEMIVAPNLPLHAGVGSLAGLFVGMTVAAFVGGRALSSTSENQTGGGHGESG